MTTPEAGRVEELARVLYLAYWPSRTDADWQEAEESIHDSWRDVATAALTTQAETIRRLEGEVARLTADLNMLVDKNEPEPGALHYDECPYKPFAELPSWEEPDDAPPCTCSANKKGAYWKARWMLTNGWRRVAEQRAEAAEGRGTYTSGYLAGQLAMRERAAKRAQKPLAPTSYATTYSDAIAQAIRALEPSPATGEGA